MRRDELEAQRRLVLSFVEQDVLLHRMRRKWTARGLWLLIGLGVLAIWVYP